MNETIQIQNMSTKQISELLRTDWWNLPTGLADAVLDFISRIGGAENAWAAVKMLNELEKNG